MYLAYLDEAGHTDKKNFTVCGLTIVEAEKALSLSNSLQKIRADYGFSPTDFLKFSSSSRPNHVSLSSHTEAKKRVMELAGKESVKFLGYAYFNPASYEFKPDRNRLYGFNTLLGNYDRFLREQKSFGVAIVDRIDLGKIAVSGYASGFDYLKEKFQKGNKFSSDYKNIENIISYSMASEGNSHLSILNDVLTGSLLYLANGSDISVRKLLQKQLEGVMLRSPKNVFRNYGLTLRPADRAGLDPTVGAEYDQLRIFLNTPSEPQISKP